VSLWQEACVFTVAGMYRVLKLALKVCVLAPVFTVAVIVAIFCGTMFDLERPRGTSDRLEG
jgi:hypothetical protein